MIRTFFVNNCGFYQLNQELIGDKNNLYVTA